MVDLDDTEVFHGPRVSLPEISFRDMAGFVDEALKTVEERFEVVEKEIYRSSARQQPGSPEWFMAASTKTKGKKQCSLYGLEKVCFISGGDILTYVY